MWRLPLFALERRAFVLAVAALLALLAAWSATSLRLDVSADAIVPARGGPEAGSPEAAADRFGPDEAFAVYAEGDLFTPAGLRALRAVHDGLAGLPFVARVDSLLSVPDLREEDGGLVLSPLLANPPDDPAALAALRRGAVDNPLLRRTLLSEDGRSTLLRIVPLPAVLPAALPAALPGDREVRDAVERILAPHRAALPVLQQVGGPALRSTMLDYLARDQRRILPPTLVLLFVLLALALRSPLLALLPIAGGVLATLLLFGAMAALSIPLNLLSAMLPALILVIGGMEDVHLCHEYRERLQAHGLDRLAVFETTERIGLAVVLNSLTTLLGFASTALTDIPILRDFGLAAALGMGLRFLCTLFVLPALLGLLVPRLGRARRRDDEPAQRLVERLAHAIVDRGAPRVRWVVAGMLAFTALALVAARDIPRSNDLLSFLARDDDAVRAIERAERRLSGFEVLHVTLASAPDAFSRREAVARLGEVTAWLRGLPGVDAATSLSDVVERLSEQLHGDRARRRLPADDAELAQLLLFVDPGWLAPYVTPDRAAADIVVRTGIRDAARLTALAREIRAGLDSGRFGPQVYTLGGRALVIAESVESITLGQVLSLGSMIAILFVIVAVLFLSVRAGLVAVAVNVVAVVAMFGVMGLFRIPLNVGTCMVAGITLGIVIDDTLHLLVRYSREVRRHRDERPAIRAALAGESGPMLATAGALAGGFVLLGFSSFLPVRQFGLLSAGVIVVAVVTDMVLSPVLLANTRIVTLWDALGLDLRQTLIRRSPFFRGLSRWQAKRVVLASTVESYESGARIIAQGEVGDTMYVILEGAVTVSRGDGAARTNLAVLTEGDVFGEMGLVRNAPRSADVVARGRTRVLVWSRRSLGSMTRLSPYLVARLMENLAQLLAARVARLDGLVAEARPAGPAGRAPPDWAG